MVGEESRTLVERIREVKFFANGKEDGSRQGASGNKLLRSQPIRKVDYPCSPFPHHARFQEKERTGLIDIDSIDGHSTIMDSTLF